MEISTFVGRSSKGDILEARRLALLQMAEWKDGDPLKRPHILGAQWRECSYAAKNTWCEIEVLWELCGEK